VAFQKYSLWNTTVFNSVFNDVDCIIIKVVVYYAFSDTIIFIRVFNDWFLEICIELKNLFMKFSMNKYNKLNRLTSEILTYLSYLSHLGAILGIASFSCGLRCGIPVNFKGLPSLIDYNKSGFTFSCRLVVFSIMIMVRI
jgi:hypothetical protein